ncbi:MAG: SLC13 family permease [Halobacteria archaeon]|nr:SLC13 family permease [Halobacteria archaeon]
MLIVFAIITVTLFLFATEVVPVDITAIGIMVTLIVLGPWTEVTPAEGVSGFSSVATITVLAMFILSDGVQRTGLVQLLGAKLIKFTRESESRQLGATMGIVGPISGFINNTAAVAILLPMVIDIAEKGKTSPSKLLIPLSYASMFGGMLTLIGTSTNILASDITARLASVDPRLHAFSMFEFTHLGAIVTVVGIVYLLTLGRFLIPERIKAQEDLTEEFEVAEYLTEVVVREDSPFVGKTVEQAISETDFDVDVLQIIRGDRTFMEPFAGRLIHAGDVFMLRTDRDTLMNLIDEEGLDLVPEIEITDEEIEDPDKGQTLVEVVIAPGSSLTGQTLTSSNFRDRYDGTVLALRRGGELIRKRLDDVRLSPGDTLLIQATTETIDRLIDNRNFIVAREVERHDYRSSKMPVAVGIVSLVVALAALNILPIMVSALGGALAMVLTGCIKPTELYDSIQWDVIFLLAGVIPLGIAMQETGAAELLANLIIVSADFLPHVVVLGIFYIFTALLTNVISNNASVVLMIPVAISAATEINANPFAFVLAVTFAASTAFMTPVGYQTNLFIYGPGGYKFMDYMRVGGPLQMLFAVVTTLGIAFFWGV